MSEEHRRRQIVSRRTRPSKAALSRDVIVSTGLEILGRDGLPGLSLRRIAAALDTGPASLYVYIENLEDLYALMLDQALAAVDLPRDQRVLWRDRTKALLHSYRKMLYERPGLAQLAMSVIATGPNALRIWEALLGLLNEGGVDGTKAAWGVDMLTLYVTAIAAEQSNWRASGHDFGRVKKALAEVTAEQFPLVYAAFNGPTPSEKQDYDSRTDWALDVIIDGIVGAGGSRHSR